MRTISYQPVYINPQAYFVFPSLYHIEKGDSEDKLTVYEHNSRELGNILNNEEWNKNEEIL